MTDSEPEVLGDRVLNRYDVMMREDVTPVLRELGFTGTRRKFTMRRNGACGVLEWQKDSRAYRYGEVRFTANMDWWCGSGRIGELIPAYHPSVWWTVTAGKPTAPVARSVLTGIRCFALPAILAGLDDPAPQPKDPAMHGPWAGPDPDGGGTEPGAWFIQPTGTKYDPWFTGFASDEPRDRLHAAYLAVTADSDQRTVPALLDRLEHDPDPAVRKLIASRMLPRLGHDPQVRPALRRTAAEDKHPGVRWAGRYALRIIETPDLDTAIARATTRE